LGEAKRQHDSVQRPEQERDQCEEKDVQDQRNKSFEEVFRVVMNEPWIISLTNSLYPTACRLADADHRPLGAVSGM
jgi:hypothetical protein